MLYGVIDIGSNSVRLMISDGIKTISKHIKVTKLAQRMDKFNNLDIESVERTVNAVAFFVEEAEKIGAQKILIFATAAVRKALNKQSFLEFVYSKTGYNVEVISGEKESLLGALGVLNGKDGGIIDIGGASTEIAVIRSGQTLYSKSINLGAVTLTDACGQSMSEALRFAKELIKGFGEIDCEDFYIIGGTATSIASVLIGNNVYDSEKVNGFKLELIDVENCLNKFYSLSIEERKKIIGLQKERAEIIAGGCAILYSLMNYLSLKKVVVSETDNLEGYLLNYRRENEKQI